MTYAPSTHSRTQAKHEDLRTQFNATREQMDKERAAARTSEHLADLRREGSVKAAEFERLANLLEEEADEVEAQYRRMERASTTLRGAQREVGDLLQLLGGVLEDLVDLEESADDELRRRDGTLSSVTSDAGRGAEDVASASAFEAARAAAIASAASLLRDAGSLEGKSYATSDRIGTLAATTTEVAAELVVRMESALDEEEGTRKLLERARNARRANGGTLSPDPGSEGGTSVISGSVVDPNGFLRVGGGYAGSPPKHGHALRAKMSRDLEMHVRALTTRAKKAAKEADLLERHLAGVDRFQDESVGELELALWLLRGVDELTRREKAERAAAAKARSDKFKPSGQSVKYGKLKSIADKKRTDAGRKVTSEGTPGDDGHAPSALHRHHERVQQRRRDKHLGGFDLNGGDDDESTRTLRPDEVAENPNTVRKALVSAMDSAVDEDAPRRQSRTPPPPKSHSSALPPTPGVDVSAKILNDGKTPARAARTPVGRLSESGSESDAEGETFHTPATTGPASVPRLPRRNSMPPTPSSPAEHKSTYILPFGKSTYKSFKRNVLGMKSKKEKPGA